MQKVSSRTVWALAGMIGMMTACGGSPTGTNSGDPLSEEEVQVLLNELAGSMGGLDLSGGSQQQVASGLNLSTFANAVPVDESFNFSAPCEGGSISMSGRIQGDVDDQTFASDLNVRLTWDFENCVVTTEATTLTVNGDPEIELNADFVIDQETFSVSGTERGGFRFEAADGRMGSCAIDLTFDVSVSQGSTQASVSGEVCGISGERFVVIGAPTA